MDEEKNISQQEEKTQEKAGGMPSWLLILYLVLAVAGFTFFGTMPTLIGAAVAGLCISSIGKKHPGKHWVIAVSLVIGAAVAAALSLLFGILIS